MPYFFPNSADSEEYMRAVRTEILETDGYPFACSLIATDIAELLIRKGHRPRLLTLRGKLIDSINTAALVPQALEGRVRWGGHTVCELSGLTYDPLISIHPAETEAYLATTFLERAEIEKVMEGAQLDNFLSR